MKPILTILLVEDDPNDAKLLVMELNKHYSTTIQRVQTEEEFVTALNSTSPDIILSDFSLPTFNGMRALEIRQQLVPHLPFVLVTGSINESTAVSCMKAGADDYIIKEHLHRLASAINAALDKQKLIKEKRQIEWALRLSEERFRSALDNSPVMVFNQDRSLRYTWVYHPFHHRVEEMIGKTDQELFASEDAAILTEIKKRVIESGDLIREIIKITFSDLAYHYDLTVEPMHDSENGIIGITCTAVDITEQIRMRNALKLSEKRFRSIFQDNLAVMLLIDPDNGAIIDMNEAAIKYYGWTRERLLTMSMHQINTLPREELLKEMDSARKKNRVHFEFSHRRADGSVRDVEVFTSKIEIGSKDYLHSIIYDITERKSVQKKLYLHTAALQSAANAIVITDADGLIISVNPAFTTLTGYTQDEVIGKKTNVLKSGKQDESYYKRLWDTIMAGNVWRNEIVNKRKDGSFYSEEMTITPVVNEMGIITNFVAMKQDITEQRNLQQQLFQSQKVESIGTLAGGIAHDFNNILGIILAYATLIERAPMEPEKMKESTGAIIKAVHRGASLVKQILTFARKTDISFKPVNVPELIRELKGMLQETFPKTITIRDVIPAAIPKIHADQTQVHQALLNLCINARDAMPNGGELTITAELVSRSTITEKFIEANYDQYIRISVADTGTGIDAVTMKKIFDPFFTTKEVGKGTGMGLAVVTGIAQTHHGSVDVKSDLGKGTSIYLYFPVLQSAGKLQTAETASKVLSRDGHETILFVEDEDLLREVATALLSSKGYTVIVANDGEEAVSIYRQRHKEIDLVVTDMGLPKLTGVEEFWELKKINPKVKVLLASGFLDPDIKSDLFLGGARGFVQKPYVSEEILGAIREALDGK